jgi:hypothetical protein
MTCGASEQARLRSFILVILNQGHGPCGLQNTADNV